jgi:hypothetical protein
MERSAKSGRGVPCPYEYSSGGGDGRRIVAANKRGVPLSGQVVFWESPEDPER